MAGFCVDCIRQEFEETGESFAERGWIISQDAELCENCGEWTPVVVRQERHYFLYLLFARKK